MTLRLALLLSGVLSFPTHACTIFVLTSTNRVLFCNNEDWSNPKTQIWFVPGAGRYHGAVYVGFDDDYPQGGLNTEGLAFDWVAGFDERWQPDPNVDVVVGNSGQQVLETCASVEEAIAFYQKHQDSGFHRAKILLADASGMSAIIGGKDGKLQIEKAAHTRGFGYGQDTLKKLLAGSPESTPANGVRILKACLQQGQYATKYFNVFDLKSGDILLNPSPEHSDEVKLNLAAELRKGGHYYDLPQIREQLSQAPRPLRPGMIRFLLEKYQPIPDMEPAQTAHVRAMAEEASQGKERIEDYSPELWKEVCATKEATKASYQQLGRLVAVTLVDRGEHNNGRLYRYRLEFERHTLLQQVVFDAQNKLVSSNTEDYR